MIIDNPHRRRLSIGGQRGQPDCVRVLLSKARLMQAGTIVRWCALGALLITLSACGGDNHLTFLNPQGPVAEAQRWHFYWVLAVMIVLVAGPIFVLLPFWAWRYRYGNKNSKYKPRWEDSKLLMITNWGGPVIIVAILAFFVWHDSHKLDPYKPLPSDQAPLRVQVIGYDWKWLFIYPDQGIATIGTLAVPTGRPISMQITSATVMQSLFIPAYGSQMYAMGGMVSQLNLQADKTGRSLGENTMYNGNGFHKQKFIAQAMPPAQFDAWVKTVRTTGVALDPPTLKIISRRADRSDLIAALPKAKARAMNGDVYFSHVSKNLFPAVVKATMDGQQVLPRDAFMGDGPTSPGTRTITGSIEEQK